MTCGYLDTHRFGRTPSHHRGHQCHRSDVGIGPDRFERIQDRREANLVRLPSGCSLPGRSPEADRAGRARLAISMTGKRGGNVGVRGQVPERSPGVPAPSVVCGLQTARVFAHPTTDNWPPAPWERVSWASSSPASERAPKWRSPRAARGPSRGRLVRRGWYRSRSRRRRGPWPRGGARRSGRFEQSVIASSKLLESERRRGP